jgi:hypothetical protein
MKVDGFPIHVLVEQHKSYQSSEMQINLYAPTENAELGKFFVKVTFLPWQNVIFCSFVNHISVKTKAKLLKF